MSDEGWPRIADGEEYVHALRELQQRVRRLYGAYIFLALCMALVGVGVVAYDVMAERARSERFCLVAQQTVNSSTSEEPVSEALLAAAEALGCRIDLPAGISVDTPGA